MYGLRPWLPSMSWRLCRYSFYLTMLSVSMLRVTCGQNYSHHMDIYRDKLDRAVYNTEVPPLLDQSRTVYMYVNFELLSIVQVDEVYQSFVCNGILIHNWQDELLAWNPADYGGQKIIYPRISQIWNPRIFLVNTLGKRNIFDNDDSTISVFHNGYVIWSPGSLFTTACELDMTYYPYDEQTCYIELSVMSPGVEFIIYNTVETTFFTKGGEWDFLNGTLTTVNYTGNRYDDISTILISFQIRRNPVIIMISIVLPVVFLSFMNLMVFIIPVESGEKIGYGMAVLLSLSVFMSTISSMLPRASHSVPLITIYLFSLLVMSLFTVIDAVIIVKLHHMEEKEDERQKQTATLKQNTKIITKSRSAVSPFRGPSKPSSERTENPRLASETTSSTNGVKMHKTEDIKCPYNKYKTIGKYIDMVSFAIFFSTWLGFTLAFMLKLSRAY